MQKGGRDHHCLCNTRGENPENEKELTPRHACDDDKHAPNKTMDQKLQQQPPPIS